MDEDERVAGALGDEVGPENRLTDAGRPDKNADVVREERSRRVRLDARQLACEFDLQRRAIGALVLDRELAAVLGK
jgi:hypothetical protein